MTEPKITPTQDLIMETLAARHRLGESLWTFDSRHSKALSKLQELGLVQTMHGIVEKTVRASLTVEGRDMYIDNDYVPPVFR